MATLSEAQAQLAAWEAASLAIASGKEHQIGDRRIRLEDAAQVANMIRFWERKIAGLEAAAAGRRSGAGSYAVARFTD